MIKMGGQGKGFCLQGAVGFDVIDQIGCFAEAPLQAIKLQLSGAQRAVSNPLAAEALQLIPAILLSRFNDRSIEEIFGQGQAEGEALGETTVILRLLNRRCGPLDAATAPTARRRRREPELQGC
jgi:hypothetical protein